MVDRGQFQSWSCSYKFSIEVNPQKWSVLLVDRDQKCLATPVINYNLYNIIN